MIAKTPREIFENTRPTRPAFWADILPILLIITSIDNSFNLVLYKLYVVKNIKQNRLKSGFVKKRRQTLRVIKQLMPLKKEVNKHH